MHKVLHLESSCYSQNILDKLNSSFHLVCLDIKSQSDLVKHLRTEQYFGIFTKLGLMLDSEALGGQKELKCIISPTTGLNHIDIEYCLVNQIEIISLKGEADFLSQVKSTAEHTWLLLLSLLRNHVNSVLDVIENGNWNRVDFLSEEINGKTIGIIGFGRLGKIVARYAEAFSAKVIVNDISKIAPGFLNRVEFTNIDELLSRSDVVILMINYLESNIKFFNQEKFSLIKKGSYFINISRGELIDEFALLNALKSRNLKGAALDVLDGDSSWGTKFNGNKLLLEYAKNNSNLIITPHVGGYGQTSISKTRNFIVEKFLEKYIG